MLSYLGLGEVCREVATRAIKSAIIPGVDGEWAVSPDSKQHDTPEMSSVIIDSSGPIPTGFVRVSIKGRSALVRVSALKDAIGDLYDGGEA